MSEQQSNGQAASNDESLKAEISELKNTFQKQQSELMASIQSLKAKPAPAPVEEDVEAQLYTNPKAVLERFKQEAKQEALQAIGQYNQTESKRVNTLSALQNDFPELADTSHPLTKEALQIWNALPEEDKSSPMSYRVAVREAAENQGLKPKSKRPVVDEDTMSGGYSGSRGRTRVTKIDQATAEWGELLGLDMEDAGVKERLLARSQREFGKYGQPTAIKGKK
jgi:hypothetical protein